MKNVLLSLGLLVGSTAAMATSLDLTKSHITWESKKVISGGHNGLVKIKSLEVTEEKDQLKSGLVVIDLNQIQVNELEGEWKDKFLGHIKSADFFDVEKYPTASFKIDSVQNDELIGHLTIKDKTNPIKVKFKKENKTYSGQIIFDRTLYDLTYGSNNFFKNLGDKAISNDVKIGFVIVLK
jgi:polyisoprenoid-binding protein YceI